MNMALFRPNRCRQPYDMSPFTLRFGLPAFLKYYHNTIIGRAPLGAQNVSHIPVQTS